MKLPSFRGIVEVRASLPTFNCLRRDVYTVAD